VDLAGGAPFALKTGTSSGWRDAWAAAFTAEVTAVVWLGDPAGRPLGAVSGFEAAAPAAARLVAAALERVPVLGLARAQRDPVRLVRAKVCAETGLAAGPRCAHAVEERFAPGTVPSRVCDAHDARGDVLLATGYRPWVERTRPAGVSDRPLAPPDDDATLTVREPRDGARWLFDPAQGKATVALRAAAGGAEVGDVAWEVDGVRLEGARWDPSPGDHVVIAERHGHRSRPSRVRVRWAR
jgi:penicillin-binding protein 1C